MITAEEMGIGPFIASKLGHAPDIADEVQFEQLAEDLRERLHGEAQEDSEPWPEGDEE